MNTDQPRRLDAISSRDARAERYGNESIGLVARAVGVLAQAVEGRILTRRERAYFIISYVNLPTASAASRPIAPAPPRTATRAVAAVGLRALSSFGASGVIPLKLAPGRRLRCR